MMNCAHRTIGMLLSVVISLIIDKKKLTRETAGFGSQKKPLLANHVTKRITSIPSHNKSLGDFQRISVNLCVTSSTKNFFFRRTRIYWNVIFLSSDSRNKSILYRPKVCIAWGFSSNHRLGKCISINSWYRIFFLKIIRFYSKITKLSWGDKFVNSTIS